MSADREPGKAREQLLADIGPNGLGRREEIARRIRAARELRQMNQVELSRLLEGDGLGKDIAGRLERCEIQFHNAHRRALVEHLRVPDRWFIEDVDTVVGFVVPPLSGPQTGEEVLDRIRELTAELNRAAEGLLNRLGRDMSRRDLQSRRARGQGRRPEADAQ